MAGEGDDGALPPSRKFLLALVVLLLFFTFLLVRPYLGAVVLALLLGFLLQRPYRALLRRVRFPSLAAGLILLVVFAALVGPIAFIVRSLADEAGMVVALLQDPAGMEAAAARALAQFGVDEERVTSLIQDAGQAAAGGLQGALLPTLSKAAHFLGSLLVFSILLFFVLRDGERAIEVLGPLTPLRPAARERLLGLVADRTRAIALGTFLVSIIQGVASGLGWWFFGFPAPVFWGFVMTIIAVLPLGAPFLVMVPAGILALLQGNLFAGIGILVYAAVIVGLIDDLLRPYVVGRRSGVHPAVILVGTLGGITVFGVSGFLLGPLVVSMLEPVLQVWAEERRASTGAPVEGPAEADFP